MLFDAGSIVAYVLPTGSGINNSDPYGPGSYTLAYATSGPSSVETETAGIQEALNFVAGRGGGTVRMYGGPGYTYTTEAPINLLETVNLIGDGCMIEGSGVEGTYIVGNQDPETLSRLTFKGFGIKANGHADGFHVVNMANCLVDLIQLNGNAQTDQHGMFLDVGTAQQTAHNRVYVRIGQSWAWGWYFLGDSSLPTTLNEYGGEIYNIGNSTILVDAYADTNWGTFIRSSLKNDAIGLNWGPNGTSGSPSFSPRHRILELALDQVSEATGTVAVQIGFGANTATSPSLIRIDDLQRGGISGNWADPYIVDNRGGDAAVDYFIADLLSQTMYRPSWWY
jgi:hypothetical protein